MATKTSTMTTHVMTLRFPVKLARQIERAARADDLSVNQWMKRAAADRLDAITTFDRELAREKAMEEAK